MSLIWTEGPDGAPSLAPLLQQARLAAPPAGAVAAYADAVTNAETYLATLAAQSQPRTHVLIIGVGAYRDASIPAVTTSVYGACKFADFFLEDFSHDDRPLGSIEMLLSPGVVGDYRPKADVAEGKKSAAERLGFPQDANASLSVEEATFNNIQDAFERWLKRASAHAGNAALLYFAGHGVWKGSQILLPEDARLPAPGQSARNLIAIEQTLANMFNTEPGVQCFFVDACQEINSNVLLSVSELPANALFISPPDALVPRDASLFFGSSPGQLAYGPSTDAPYFTQELIACLTRRGADEFRGGNTWSVTTNSLRIALNGAWRWRAEKENLPLQFATSQEPSVESAEICRIQGEPEVFVRVVCSPSRYSPTANLFLKSMASQVLRTVPRADEWWYPVQRGDWTANAVFGDPTLRVTPSAFAALPPRTSVFVQIDTTGGNP